MKMSNYAKGRAKEYECMRILERQNYHCFRTAGSHTPFDVIAVLWGNGKELPLIRFMQVKYGKKVDKKTIKEIENFKLPAIIQKEIWHFRPRKGYKIIIIKNDP